MAIQEQMEMFKNSDEDVELLQEGGGVDTQSGNAVPLGGTQEGVRDDISANVSEGEMVIPAEVVRYHGVEAFMQMRDQAMMGYKKMEAMGQFGNPDEAKIPNDSMFNANGLPFSVVDLEYVDDEAGPMEEPSARYGGMPAFQTGGVVPVATQGTVPTTSFLQQPQTTPITAVNQITGQPVTTGSTTFAPAPTANLTVPTSFTPTTLAGVNPTTTPLPVAGTTAPVGTPTLPSFGTVSAGTTSINFFRNEAGEVIQIPVLNGRQTFEAPEGFVRFDPDKPEVPSEFPGPTTPEADRPVSEGRKEEEEIFTPGTPEESEQPGGRHGPPEVPEFENLDEMFNAIADQFGGGTTGPTGDTTSPGAIGGGGQGGGDDTGPGGEDTGPGVGGSNDGTGSDDTGPGGGPGEGDTGPGPGPGTSGIGGTVGSPTGTDDTGQGGEDTGPGDGPGPGGGGGGGTGGTDGIGGGGTGGGDDTGNGDGGGDGGGDGSVICTELLKQNLLSKDLYNLETFYADKYISEYTVNGYRFWAVPYVKLMRKSKLACKLVAPLATAWGTEVISQYSKDKKIKGSILGKILRLSGEPLCYIIGRLIKNVDYKILYVKEGKNYG